jgi:Flp pilus assembly protein TadG
MASLVTDISRNLSLPQRGAHMKLKISGRQEDGQGLVELALVVPLFILLLVGSAEFARLAWVTILTSNAARAGASFGAHSLENSVNTAGIQAAAAADSINLTGLTTAPPSISCVCSNGTAIPSGQCANALSYCASPATITDYVTVNTTSTVSIFGHSFTATGMSTLVVAP